MRYEIKVRETGELITWGDTMTEASQILTMFEESDRQDGLYTPDFYEIKEGY